jgi:DNA-directed RNA polymerase specialized sigma24 family protein
MRLARSTLTSEDSQAVFGKLLSTHGSQEQIEADILVHEILGQLTAEERSLWSLKKSGLSSREIAKKQGTSVGRVNILFYRMKRKIRNALRFTPAGVS